MLCHVYNCQKSGSPTLKLIGSVESAKGVIVYSPKEIVDMYPLSYGQLFLKLKANVDFKQPDLTEIIKTEKLKTDAKYSYFVFRNALDRDNYEKNGKYSKTTPSVYNAAAVTFLSEKLQQITKAGK